MYLLDTPVISELRQARSGACDHGLVRWASGVARPSLYISALTLLELESSAARLDRTDRTQADAARAWLDTQVVQAFDGRIMPVDANVVRRRRALPDVRANRDALLAATAQEHGLTLVTRNTAAFKSAKLKVFNPWGYTPDIADEADDWQQVARSGSAWLKNLFVRG